MRKLVAVAACVMLVAGLAGCPKPSESETKAVQLSVVDFEGLDAGCIVSSLSSGNGITGPLIGTVSVVGVTPSLLPANTAIIFDTANPTGGDLDLGTPNENFGGPGIGTGGETTNINPLGKALILAEDLVDTNPMDGKVDDPDDTFEKNATFSFDFTGVQGGVVDVLDMTVIDVEAGESGAFIQVEGPALPVTQIPIPTTGDNGVATIVVNAPGVSKMIVNFNGSGAIGEFQIEQEVEEDDGGFRTQTQGGWGTRCRGNNPGCYRDANFDSCFPNGLQVGCEPGNSIILTSSAAVQDFLPEGGPAAALTQDYTDPDRIRNVLAGQVVALTLSVGFDLCDPNFSESNTALADLEVIDPESKCFGMTVQEVLDLANAILGGCSTALTPSEINDCVSDINENFVDGETDNGFLG
jgi:hypothetical protein